MPFTYDQYMIKAFTTHTPQQAFTDRVRPRCFDGRLQHFNPASCHYSFEVRRILRIVIPNEVLELGAEWSGLSHLLRDPLVCGRTCHTNVDDAPRAELGDDEGKQRPKENVGDLNSTLYILG